MKSVYHKKYSFNPNHLLIDHIIDFKYQSNKQTEESEQKLFEFISDKNKFNIKPFFTIKETDEFLSSKLKAMEKMSLNDECFEGKIETRKINIDKNVFPKSKHYKNKSDYISPRKKVNNKIRSRKKSENKRINKNIMINANGKKEKYNMESFDLIDDINIDINTEIKESKANQLFSDRNLLTSIISEIEGK